MRLALPTDFSSMRNKLQASIEAGVDTADPWGGSYFIERLTQDLITKAQGHIDEISALGGMPKAIAQGLPKLRIEESSAKTQARIDSARQVIVGVNKHVCNDDDVPDVLVVDNAQVRQAQLQRLETLRLHRDEQALQQALNDSRSSGSKPSILDLSIKAARAHATVGEMSFALERVYGRHQAKTVR